MITAITILAAWLLADLLSGCVHWFEDKVMSMQGPIEFVNSLMRDNERHHAQPSLMLKISKWQNMRESALLAWPVALALFVLDFPLVLSLAMFFAGFANVVHRYAHTPRVRCPLFVRIMQRTGLFISFKQHHGHHYSRTAGRLGREQSTRGYCAMTSWLNPILDYLGVFPKAERALARIRK